MHHIFYIKSVIVRLYNLIIFCLLISNSCLASSEAINLISEAIRYKNSENYNSAIVFLNKSIKIAKDPIQKKLANILLGECLMKIENFKEAINHYNTLLSEAQLSFDEILEVKYRLAQCYLMIKQYYNARNICNEILKSGNENYKRLANILLNNIKSKFEVAIRQNDNFANLKSKESTISRTVETIKKLDDTIQNRDIQSRNSSKGKLMELISESSLSESKVNSVASIEHNKPIINIESIINLPKISSEIKENFAIDIIKLKEKIDKNADYENIDKLFYDYASMTAQIGEFLEACKSYDKILRSYPGSKFIEEAYFEAIRLRFLLGKYKPVVEWGRMFLDQFPESKYSGIVQAIIELAIQNAKKFKNIIDLSNENSQKKYITKKRHSLDELNDLQKSLKSAQNQAEENIELKTETKKETDEKIGIKKDVAINDPLLKEAKRKMKEGRYIMALRDFESLVKKYPNSVDVLWNLALVQVQQELHDKAAKTLEKLLSIEPQNNDARSLLAYCHYKCHNISSAADIYESDDSKDFSSQNDDGLNFFSTQYIHKKLKSRKNLQ